MHNHSIGIQLVSFVENSTMCSTPYVKLDRASLAYPDTPNTGVLNNLSWELNHSGLALIQAPNMSGKTTLLRILADDLPLNEGTVEVTKPLEYLPQSYECTLFPWKDVGWNVALPALIRDPSVAAKDAARSLLCGLPLLRELDDIWESYPGKLSGGMRHLITIARAFCSRAAVLLLDEPFTGLDADRLDIVVDSLSAYIKLNPHSMILLVTHRLPGTLPPHLLFRLPPKPFSAVITCKEE